MAIACAPPSAAAQVLSLSGGGSTAEGANTYTWALGYQHPISQRWAASLVWLNEGHIPNHHRDGPALQWWARMPLRDSHWVLEAGVGPYFYFDTATPSGAANYTNDHGIGMVASARATYRISKQWITQMQLNRIQIARGPDSTAVVFGVGYQLNPVSTDAADGPSSTGAAVRDAYAELSVYGGQTIVNSMRSPTAPAAAIDLRVPITRHVSGSVGYLHESVHQQARRDGLTTQLWLTQAFENDRFELGAAAGLYYALDEYEDSTAPGPGEHTIAALISISAAYRFSNRWVARLTWNRVATHYDRDTDVIMAGIGYRF